MVKTSHNKHGARAVGAMKANGDARYAEVDIFAGEGPEAWISGPDSASFFPGWNYRLGFAEAIEWAASSVGCRSEQAACHVGNPIALCSAELQ